MAEASVVRRTAAAAERLHELVSQLEPGQLQHDPIESQALSTLRELEETTRRIILRHECRAAATRFGLAIEATLLRPADADTKDDNSCDGGDSGGGGDGEGGGGEGGGAASGRRRSQGGARRPLHAALSVLYPDYFTHTPASATGGQEVWVSKLYVTPVPVGAAIDEGASLCVRFNLVRDLEVNTHDLSLQVLRCADGVSQPAVSSTLSLSFRLQDLAASDAGRWSLDEAQLAKLSEVAGLLGLSPPLWSATATLGLLLEASGAGRMHDLPFFQNLQASIRNAHREGVLSVCGDSF